MFRFRKYRAFLIVAVILIFILLRFSKNDGAFPDADARAAKGRIETYADRTPVGQATTKKPVGDAGKTSYAVGKAPNAEPGKVSTAPPKKVTPTKSTPVAGGKGAISDHKVAPVGGLRDDDDDAEDIKAKPLHAENPSKVDVTPEAATFDTVRWKKPKEHFPVPINSLIALPTGEPIPIPQIQHKFPAERDSAKIVREKRLSAVKDEFLHAWKGYKGFAWGHDELKPVSGTFSDPFCGWAATLVDSLDTLWIMGLVEDFEEAVLQVEKIDFSTTTRPEIPLFETTIRYLGGLLSAYELSGIKYTVLLRKAKELAEILLAAFDTPNRMPLLYYQWRPSFADNPHRASMRANFAELGSMSLEFTRLAQITKDAKYYDAIARVTNALEEWQTRGTGVDGLFPDQVDISGCNRSATDSNHNAFTSGKVSEATLKDAHENQAPTPGEPVSHKGQVSFKEDEEDDVDEIGEKPIKKAGTQKIEKRQVIKPEVVSNVKIPTVEEKIAAKAKGVTTTRYFEGKEWDCVPQGLALPLVGDISFSMGGWQDSTYEYFSKEWLLLGGLEPKYKELYLKTLNGVRERLLFRPMVPQNDDILVSGRIKLNGMRFETEMTHLTCFLGGMVGMGAKIFDIKGDLEIAKKLTDGCLWAYSSTTSGLMPEYGHLVPCKSMKSCKWDEDIYGGYIDPEKGARDDDAKKFNQAHNLRDANGGSAATKTTKKAPNDARADAGPPAIPTGSDVDVDSPPPASTRYEADLESEGTGKHSKRAADDGRPPRMLTHKEFVSNRIASEHIPPGYSRVIDAKYILRPEAIESVWYMYRITGDASWQEKGWKMFEAIIAATRTKHGHSAVKFTNQKDLEMDDSMESFWLSETLKYFYLLFSPPTTISLDEWVLNTEAHPFKRPVQADVGKQ